MKRFVLFVGILIIVTILFIDVIHLVSADHNLPHESNISESIVTESNYPILKSDLEIRVVEMENRINQLEKQVRILFADSLYDRANIEQIWEGETAIIDRLPPQRATDRYRVPLSFRPPSKYPKGLDHKEEAAWKEKMLKDLCDIKQKK